MNNNFYGRSNQRCDANSQNRDGYEPNQQMSRGYNHNFNYPNDNYSNNNDYMQNSHSNNRYSANNSYHNNDYGNNYYTTNDYNGYRSFINNADTMGAEVVYVNKHPSSKLKSIIVVMFILFFVACGFSGMFINEQSINAIMYEKVIPIAVMGFMSICLLCITLQPTVNTIIKKPRCTRPVTAKIVEVKVTGGRNNGKNYYVTYKYFYEGKIYVISGVKSLSFMPPYVGKEVEMSINPNKPTEYYIDTTLINIIYLLIGGFLFSSILSFLLPTIFN